MIMNDQQPAELPDAFCWTRFGPEAGESFGEILARKNREREECGGLFLWGIGSAVGPAISALLTHTDTPEVCFSPIRSKPRGVDVAPSHVVRWTRGLGLFGDSFEIPEGACVTSRWDPNRTQTPRYALVCQTRLPLALDDYGEFGFGELSNLVSGSPVGASQVTAVVRRNKDASAERGRVYGVALRASLAWPYLIRLTEPLADDAVADDEPSAYCHLQLAI